MSLIGHLLDLWPTRPERLQIPMNDTAHILRVPRRRFTITYVSDHGATTLDELATERAAVEQDTTVHDVGTDERKNVYVALYQSHLPVLDDHDVIDWDERANRVEPAANCAPLADLIADWHARVEVPA